MKLHELKTILRDQDNVRFQLPSGENVPSHYHITEVGLVEKKFMDCGGQMREEAVISLQLWVSIDFYHRLKAEKFLNILELSEEKLDLPDLNVEVEYQGETLGKYDLSFDGEKFMLIPKQTDCLAKDQCGIPRAMVQIQEVASSCCKPGSGCC